MFNARSVVPFLLLAAAGSAQADVYATFTGVSPGSYSGSFTFDGGANWGGTGGAGLFNWTQYAGTDTIGTPGFGAFCIELNEHVGTGWNVHYNVDAVANAPTSLPGGPMGAGKADLIAELFGRHFNPAFWGSPTADQASAMQLSIWEIVYENGGPLDLSTGNAQFSVGGSAWTLAQTYLASLDGSGPRATNLVALVNDGIQDMIVPAPGTIALAGLGLVCVGRRRRNR